MDAGDAFTAYDILNNDGCNFNQRSRDRKWRFKEAWTSIVAVHKLDREVTKRTKAEGLDKPE